MGLGAVLGLGGHLGRWLESHRLVLQLGNKNSMLGLYCLWPYSTFNRFLESNWFVWVTQMNHIPMHIDHDRNVDWVSTQVRDSHLEDLAMPPATEKGRCWTEIAKVVFSNKPC